MATAGPIRIARELIESSPAAVEIELTPRRMFTELYAYAADNTDSVSIQFGETRTYAFQEVASWQLGKLLATDGARILHPAEVRLVGGRPAISVSIDDSSENAKRMVETLLATLEANGLYTDGLDEVQVIPTTWAIVRVRHRWDWRHLQPF